VTPRLVELALFSFALPLGVWGLWRAVKRDHTWIAGAGVAIAVCLFTIVTTLRGRTLMGGGHYGVDHRRPIETTTTADIALAIMAAAVGVLAIWGITVLERRRRDG
jgi:hypothetical protein